MTLQNSNLETALLTALHATVDGLCACCVFLMAPRLCNLAYIWLFIAYNSFAFLTQPLVGLWLDKRDIKPSCLGGAMLLLFSGAMLAFYCSECNWYLLPFISVLLIGVGNSVFHVYGGRTVALRTSNDIRHLGIFVSSGALGLAWGGSQATQLGAVLIMGIMAILAIGYLWHFRKYSFSVCDANSIPRASWFDKETGSVWLLAFIVLIVFFRSFLGSVRLVVTSSPLPYYTVLSVTFAVIGKAFGGFIGQKVGVWQALSITLLLAGIGFLSGHYHIVFMLAMVLFINFSMPITLHLANRILPRHTGFAFGILAAVLAPGVGLSSLCSESEFAMSLLYPLVATIVIEAVVLLSLKEHRWQVLAMSMVMNILTNIPLNIIALLLIPTLTIPIVITLEFAVVIIEAGLFYSVTKDAKQSIAYSILCNLTSYLLGLAYQLITQ